ncbi:MAG: heme-binding protein [Planctomycetales bacterium]|nr:heme-binding protein [Planctomycetales bacterium]
MRTRRMVYFSIAALVGLSVYFGWKVTARGAYESAEYKVVESDGAFEIREYPELTLVTTSTKFETQGNDGSFMRLFRYISGSNDAEQKVAMTTPVFMQRDAEDIAGKMSFVLPKEVAEQGAPKPAGDGVQLQQRQGGRFAVLRFTGRMDGEPVARAEASLRAWMTKRGLVGEVNAELAGYDPPWTPGPLRRNEVLIRF